MKTEELSQLLSEGAQIRTRDGKPYVAKSSTNEDTKLLRMIVDLLYKLVKKPDPEMPSQPAPIVRPADVIVKPAEVVFEPVKKWKFELKKDFQGRTTEIIATAMKE